MPKLKTHKGMKKRFKVSATGKVSHKRCGSSHLNSHKSGKKIRRLRKKSFLKNSAEAHRVRRAVKVLQSTNPAVVEAARLAAHEAEEASEGIIDGGSEHPETETERRAELGAEGSA